MFTDSEENLSYGSLMDLRIKRMTESRESPNFGCTSSNRDGKLYSFKHDFYNLGQHEELQDAHMKNNNMTNIFSKNNSLFSFNGSERSSQTSEKSIRENESVSKPMSDTSNITPNFLARIHIARSNEVSKTPPSSSSRGPFKNHLTQKAELVVKQKGQLFGDAAKVIFF